MLIAIDPSGNLQNPSLSVVCQVIGGALVPYTMQDWNVITKLKNWSNNGGTPTVGAVLSFQPDGTLQMRSAGTAGTWEIVRLNGNVLLNCVPNGIGSNPPTDNPYMVWALAYQTLID